VHDWAQAAEKPAMGPVILAYKRVRKQTEVLCQPLVTDDYGLQAMPETSPPKWHLAHTTWFFETFLLKPFVKNYRPYNEHYEPLFNSYYNGVCTPFPRARRGVLSRPTTAEIFRYRDAVDEHMLELLERAEPSQRALIAERVKLGLNHEQQHQELLLTDLKYNFSLNPLQPVYVEPALTPHPGAAPKMRWCEFAGGMSEMGFDPATGFCFDNETPLHQVFLHPFALASRPVTNGEYMNFIRDGGYRRPEFWLADGWLALQQGGWSAPLYWREEGNSWRVFTLHGSVPFNPEEPVCHISYYEADAYARWADARLPTEMEWEHVARPMPIQGHFINDGYLHPRPGCGRSDDMQQLFGDVWEWTASHYVAYPGFAPHPGVVGEYNGKFMCNQMVLRGGSCATDREHVRASYRNFFYPPDRWQFSGIRLARSLRNA